MTVLTNRNAALSNYFTKRDVFNDLLQKPANQIAYRKYWSTTGLRTGPLLFLVYINDLPLVSNIFNMLMYADDATVYCTIKRNITAEVIKVLGKCTKNLIGHSRLAFNNHESNIDC